MNGNKTNMRSILRSAVIVMAMTVIGWQLTVAVNDAQNANRFTLGFVQPGFAQSGAATSKPQDPLAKVEADVDRDYRSVKHLNADQLVKLRSAGKSLLIFDVREKSEYDVSRIPGAVRIDPGVWSSTFLRANANKVKGKDVVFYCSVGVRSSKLAKRVQNALMSKGATGVYNLRGGVFRWHNQKRVLEDAKGKTPLVHPYDRYWGKLVNRKNYTSYKPMPR